MYLSAGQDAVVRTGEIVGIFDMDRTTVGKDTREFLKRAQKEGRLVSAAADIPVSFVVCVGGTVILSPLNAGTLLRRINEPAGNKVKGKDAEDGGAQHGA